MTIRPASSVKGTVHVPGDKSISHRAAIFAAMAEGSTRISNFSPAEDCAATLHCLERLGVRIGRDGGDVIVNGRGKRGFRAPETPLDCANSGTTARLLAGVLAGQEFDSVLTGDASLSSRPMQRIIEPLAAMGAEIISDGGRLPLTIKGRPLRGTRYEMPVASAQVKSCVLLAGLFAKDDTTVVETIPTRDHTERMLRWLGVDITGPPEIKLNGDSIPIAKDMFIPGDISSASFLIAAAACLAGSDFSIGDVGLNPTRTAFLDTLRSLGAAVTVDEVEEASKEPRGTLRVRGGIDPAADLAISGDTVANLIDELPLLAVIGTQIAGLEVRGASELRHKESDRISTTVENLRRMNAKVEEFPDGFRVAPARLNGVRIDPRGDHRIAMAFAVAALLAEGDTEIVDADRVNISFPGFFDTLSAVVR